MGDYVYCLECKPPKRFKQITNTHLRSKHGMTVDEYLKLHPDADIVCQSVRDKLVAANEAKWSDPKYKDRVSKTISGVIIEQWKDGKYSRTQTEEHKRKKNAAQSKTMCENPRFGEDAGNWRGGSSFEPYCEKFNNQFKECIRDRFNRLCFLCGMTEKENGRKLDVHHVNYDKSCLCNDVDCEFVPLCQKCHVKTNGDREYWESYIMEKLELERKKSKPKRIQGTLDDWM